MAVIEDLKRALANAESHQLEVCRQKKRYDDLCKLVNEGDFQTVKDIADKHDRATEHRLTLSDGSLASVWCRGSEIAGERARCESELADRKKVTRRNERLIACNEIRKSLTPFQVMLAVGKVVLKYVTNRNGGDVVEIHTTGHDYQAYGPTTHDAIEMYNTNFPLVSAP